MPMRSARFPFEDSYVGSIAPAPGVYALWAGDTILFYGVADEPGGLRGSLRSHHRGDGMTDTEGMSHFQVEPAGSAMTPRERQDQLLQEHLWQQSTELVGWTPTDPLAVNAARQTTPGRYPNRRTPS